MEQLFQALRDLPLLHLAAVIVGICIAGAALSFIGALALYVAGEAVARRVRQVPSVALPDVRDYDQAAHQDAGQLAFAAREQLREAHERVTATRKPCALCRRVRDFLTNTRKA